MLCVCVYVNVIGERGVNLERGKKKGEKDSEEYLPCSVVEIASLNKRPMPQADEVWPGKVKQKKG